MARTFHGHSTTAHNAHHDTTAHHGRTFFITIMARTFHGHSRVSLTSWHEHSTYIMARSFPHQIHIGISRHPIYIHQSRGQGGRKLSTRELSWGSLGAFHFLWFAQCRAVIFNYPQVSVLCMPPDSVARNHPTNHDHMTIAI